MTFRRQFLLAAMCASGILATALLQGAPASAASVTSALKKCASGSRSATVHCCEEVLRKHKKPQWMEGRSCSAAVSCAPGAVGVAKPMTMSKSKTPQVYCVLPMQPKTPKHIDDNNEPHQGSVTHM